MTCSSCGADNSLGQKFCSECGQRVSAVCPNCASPIADSARFCGECGANLRAQVQPPSVARDTVTAPPPPPAAVAERRVVTVVFADLVGFTTLAEGRDAEQVRELLSRYFETARVIVGRYGGTIEKFIGDAVMAVWGAPTAHEDDPERAVRAALELVEAVGLLGAAAGGLDLELRAGVLTGEAAVTVGAEGQGMVAGDLVNTASRLQSVAPPRTVLVGQATRDAASVAISFEELGDQQLKGKSLPVPAWRAVRVVAGLGGAGRHAGLEPPFEGRDDQLRLIKELFHATARERRARLVSIVGQAGTGKSRLVREFEKYTDGLTEKVYWHVGRSPAYGEGISFWALGEMVRKRASLAERDDDRTTRQRIAVALEELVPDDADRRWMEPRLLQLLGVGEGRSGEREEVFAAWRMFFEHVAQKGPVVMAFEDLENADPGLLDFIDYVVEWSRNYPIFILGLARPELLERRTTWGAGQRSYAAIGLEPLSDEAMRQALAGLVPGLPEPAVKAILSRAEGVPLYAVETVRMLLNEGRLAEHDGVYQPVGDLTQLQVPNTLQALIAARLDALERPDRTVLFDAAVLGHSFTLNALAGVSGRPPHEIEMRLRSLIRREVLEIDVDPRSPERGQYAFVQGLVREVAYSTLSKRDRRTRHLAAARYFEALGDDELAGVLARHYLDAWRASPEGPEGEAVAAQARVALRAAAERATGLHAHDQALAYLEHLLGVTSNELEKVNVLERAALAAEAAARFDLSERYAAEAIAIHRKNDDPSGLARAASTVGRSLLGQVRLAEAINLLEGVLADLGPRDDDPAVVEMIAGLSRIKSLHNEDQAAIDLAERALVAAERLDLVEVIAGAVLTKAVSLSYLHRNREAMILLPGVLLMAESHGMVVLELRARLNLSQFALVDEPGVALSVARMGLERAQKLGLRFWELLLAGNALMAATRVGEWDWALKMGAEVIGEGATDQVGDEGAGYLAVIGALRGDGGGHLAEAIGRFEPFLADTNDPQYPDMVQGFKAWAQLTADDLDETIRLTLAHQFVDPTYGSSAYILAGHAALWQSDIEQARRVQQSLVKFAVRGKWVDASRKSLDAGILALEGRTAEAVALFSEATQTHREGGVALDTALCLLDQVAVLDAGQPAAQAAAEEARQVLDRLGAAALLEHLDRLLGRQASAPTEGPASAGSSVGITAVRETSGRPT